MSSNTFDSTLASLGINRTSTSTTPAAATSSGSQTLDQNDFLKLMTAQLKNQDPFAPVDNTQMVAQMAQFSSLSGITEMNTTLKAMSEKLGATTTSDALAYVGKTVLTEGDTAYGRTSGGLAGAVELGSDASDVAVTITDANGATLRTLNLGAQAKGTVSYDWDGLTDAGVDAGTGPFNVAVQAQNAGKQVASTPLVWAPVASVSIPSSGEPLLTLPGIGQVAVSKIRQIG
ncbi:flagellar hook assembly protein FlgD [soil metagenome]